ncbi:MAG: hypothetical protein PHR69_08005 [Sphaerochaeta sp.]|jgi:hypothetical protein|uniref:hypothetical protein n=1 Tax=Sphaerochaeta sp. S2 TaxID=2798868 RepID=UPI0018E9A625|nr:hypothetical protein [Sphaerochaeta sp. S2]MBJ2356879.1 hypothetical protein [Sphaerochaeta sp. S2]MDD4574142.1 hypothetical protein [Sphaerochaeta sp.]MDY0245212.1 hypothetical protein [Sphaerochaeta sp.]
MKKRFLLVSLLVLFALVLSSCTSTTISTKQPFSASVSFPAEGTYQILGRVDFTPSQGSAGYIDFLTYAKTIYPDTDDIVNIIVDSENTYELTASLYGSESRLVSSSYMMSGIAIAYTE